MATSTYTNYKFTFDGRRTGAGFHLTGGKVRYIAAGPLEGPLLIFLHGWYGVAETWNPQIEVFSRLGFRVVAPDQRGYGGSTVTNNVTDYRLEQLVYDALVLLEHLGRNKAIWVGHDWGCGPVWALAAHYPEVCAGVVCMAIPYRTLEFGLDELVSLVNRDIYPKDQFPLGQWDYQAFHEEEPDRMAAILDKDPENTIKFLWQIHSTESYGNPAPITSVRKMGGLFGTADAAPEIDINKTMLRDQKLVYAKLVESLKKNGSWGPNCWYRNHKINKEYSQQSVNNGVLKFPVLFIGARFDAFCDTALSRLSEPMREYCTNLTETTIDSGHWVAFEKPAETNAAILRWLAVKVPAQWPGYWSTPFVSKLSS